MQKKLINILIAILLVTIVFSGCTNENTTNSEEERLLGTWYDTSFSRQFTFYENKTVVYKYYVNHRGIGDDTNNYVAQPLSYYKWDLEDSMLHITDISNDKTGYTNFSDETYIKIYCPEEGHKLNCFKVDLESTFPIEIKHFYLTKEEIISGQSSKLKWSVTNATSLIITDSQGNELKNLTSLYYKDYSDSKSVTSSASKTYTLKASNFKTQETREVELTVTEFVPEYKIQDNVGDIKQNKQVNGNWTYVSYEEADKDYLDIVDISHSFSTKATDSSNNDPSGTIDIGLLDGGLENKVDFSSSSSESYVLTVTMNMSDSIRSSLMVFYNVFIECNGKTYGGHYTNGVGSWAITSGYKTHDAGWLSNAVSGNTFTVSFDFENPDYYYTIYGEAYEIGGFGDMSENEWWGDYAPDSYAPWES